ncbi:MAG: sialidase family protein [Planctomycetota bacterium]|nr:sialidase family protein [Planctomycetota bacterium]MDP7248545.1 sialidase family protein [Planctomycetota bacterium]
MGDLNVVKSEPVVVALSEVGEDRWGHHQFPTISALPDGRLFVTYNDTPDRNDAYGQPGPAYVSSDEGATWQKHIPDDPLLAISNSIISEVLRGEYLCVPMSPSLDVERDNIQLPGLACTANAYGQALFYRLNECPERVQEFIRSIPAVRWVPDKAEWRREEVTWDSGSALARTRKSDYVIPRPYIDNRIFRVGDRLFYPDFHLSHLLSDGSMPENFACWCMVSDDNGRSWQRLALIAYDETGELMMSEPSLVQTTGNELACVIRCTHHEQKPMLITWSSDGGEKWEKPVKLHEFGVMPQTLLLGNNVLVISYGRPGVQLLISPDGSARKWLPPIQVADDSCGYTRLLALGDSSFLLAYSDFNWSEEGQQRKAILVRKFNVARG